MGYANTYVHKTTAVNIYLGWFLVTDDHSQLLVVPPKERTSSLGRACFGSLCFFYANTKRSSDQYNEVIGCRTRPVVNNSQGTYSTKWPKEKKAVDC